MPLSDEQAEEMYRMVRELHAAMLERRSARTGASTSSERRSAPAPAASRDAGDPIVRVQPRNWRGEDMRGKRFSQCPPSFLGQLAHVLDAIAAKNAEDPDPMRQRYAEQDKRNAEAARRWRAKLEAAESPQQDFDAQQGELDAAF